MDLAERVGVAISTLSKIECGRKPLAPNLEIKILRVLFDQKPEG